MTQRIMLLTPQLPFPAHQGATLRNFGLIRGLAGQGFKITLLTLLEEGQPPPRETPLVNLCERIIPIAAPSRTRQERFRDLLLGQADMARRCWTPLMARYVEQFLSSQDFDFVQIEGLEMAAYLTTIRQHAPEVKLIYDAHNV
ncbi:MAG: hypothetical protein GYB68_11610, partial [Chloroflexi bacterium]|nr:hypothetical protein [Chloroflexota bacterium]